MVVKHHVEGYEKFVDFVQNFKTDGPTFILYTGSKLPNGDSWCPDCVEGSIFFYLLVCTCYYKITFSFSY